MAARDSRTSAPREADHLRNAPDEQGAGQSDSMSTRVASAREVADVAQANAVNRTGPPSRHLTWTNPRRETMDNYRITEKATGREVITTDQAVARAPGRWKNTATLRAWIARNGIQARPEGLNAQTKVYYPKDLGLEA